MKVPSEGLVVLSACLAGIPCTYEAEANTRDWAVRLASEGRAVLVCPEVAGGLPTPRPAAEIQGGSGADVLDGAARVASVEGEDVTAAYLLGAGKAVDAARASGARTAILKARSPACGCGRIHGGVFDGALVDGDGVAAAALKRDGLVVVSDEDIA